MTADFGFGGGNWGIASADPVHGLVEAVYWNGQCHGDRHYCPVPVRHVNPRCAG